VAFIRGYFKTEIYSPTGQCNYKLSPAPIYSLYSIPAYSNNRIISCTTSSGCWEYNINSDSWKEFTKSSYNSFARSGVVYDNKLYIASNYDTEVLDLATNTWSKLQKPSHCSFGFSSMTVWKDSIVTMGGEDCEKTAQTFNLTTKSWDTQYSENAPVVMDWSSAAKYYPKTRSWVRLLDSLNSHYASRLVKLGSRIFAIGGLHDGKYEGKSVDEFTQTSNTWTAIGVEPLNFYTGDLTVVAVPASLFAHLPNGCIGV